MKRTTSLIAVLLLIVFTAFGQDKYVLTNESAIKVTGTSTLHDWEVVSDELAGNLMFVQKGKTKKNQPLKGEITTGDLTVVVKSLKSERGETMNGKMHRALKYEEHPNVTFILTDPVSLESTKENSIGKTLKGMLEIAGAEKNVEIEVAVLITNNDISIKGSKAFQLSDFEIEPPSAMFGQIETGNDIVISFDLGFSK